MTGLIGYWKLDESSTIVKDFSGTGNDGTYSPDVNSFAEGDSVSGIHYEGGTSLNFDGSTTILNMGTGISFTHTSPFTMSVWIKALPTGVANSVLWAKSSNDSNHLHWGELINTTGRINFEMDDTASGANYLYRRGTTNVMDNKWHHIMITYSGSGSHTGVHIYLDGVEETYSAEFTSGTMTDITTTNPLYIGAKVASSTTHYFSGNMRDFRFYNYVLSTSQRLDIVNGNQGQTDMILWAKLNSGVVAHDSSGFGNHGTWVNSPTPSTSVPSGIAFNNPYCMNFAHANTQSVTIPNLLNNWTGQPFSVSFWINITSKFGASGDDVFSYYLSNPASGLSVSHSFSGNGKLRIVFRDNGSDIIAPFQTTTAMTFGSWYNVIMTYDGSGTNAFKIYFNGTQDATTGSASTFTSAFVPNFRSIGRGVSGSNLDGLIDDLRIYNRVLTAAEITSLSNGNYTPISGSASLIRGNARSNIKDISQSTNPINLAHGNAIGTITQITDTAPLIWTSGKAIKFNTIKDYINIPVVNNNFTFSGAFAISFWTKIDDISIQQDAGMFIYRNIAGNNLFVHTNHLAGIRFVYRTNAGANIFDFTKNSAFTNGSWYHVYCGYTGAGSAAARIIVNNGPPTTANGSIFAAGYGTAGTMTFGNPGNTFELTRVAMKDMRIYNRALSGTEIAALAAGSLGPTDSMLGWWPLGDGASSSLLNGSAANIFTKIA